VVAKLKALPGPGESYSDVILRLAKGGHISGTSSSFEVAPKRRMSAKRRTFHHDEAGAL